MKKVFALSFLLACLLGIATTSCKSTSDDPGFDPDKIYYDFVTLEGKSSTGTTFTFQKMGDSPMITLTTSQIIKGDDIKVGQRLMIGYSSDSGERYVSGNITVYAMISVFGPEIKEGTAASTGKWNSDRFMMVNLWRTGDYINVMGLANYTSRPRVFDLYLDSTTADSEYPELHIVYTTDIDTQRQIDLLGSFNISSIWNKPGCKGVKISYRGDLGESSTTITKDNPSEIRPAE